MSRTLDLSGYSLEVAGRELRMKPNADGYAFAFMWAFSMAFLLGLQWWQYGESKNPRRVAFDKLSVAEQEEFLQAGVEAKRREITSLWLRGPVPIYSYQLPVLPGGD